MMASPEPEDDEDGMVVSFPTGQAPTVPDSAEVEPAPEVVEGELLSDKESAALERRKGLQRLVPARMVLLVVHARQTERGERVERFAIRTTGVVHVVCQGFESWARRAWDASTMGVYRRQIKAAEAMGDRALLAEWTERREQAAEKRHKRLMELPKLARGVVAVALGSAVGLVVVLFVADLIVWLADVGPYLPPVSAALTVAGWAFTVVAFVRTPAVASIPLWVLLAAWREAASRVIPQAGRLCHGCATTPGIPYLRTRDTYWPGLDRSAACRAGL